MFQPQTLRAQRSEVFISTDFGFLPPWRQEWSEASALPYEPNGNCNSQIKTVNSFAEFLKIYSSPPLLLPYCFNPTFCLVTSKKVDIPSEFYLVQKTKARDFSKIISPLRKDFSTGPPHSLLGLVLNPGFMKQATLVGNIFLLPSFPTSPKLHSFRGMFTRPPLVGSRPFA